MSLLKIKSFVIDDTTANDAFGQANSAASFANGAFLRANSAASFANAAFITANTVYGWGNHASVGYATTTYVGTQIANLVNSAPSTLDTLNELAAALGNDANFSTTITTTLGITNSFANGAFLRANSAGSFANAAYAQANAAYTQAYSTGSYSATASGNITAGSPVAVNSDGTLSAVTGAQQVGPAAAVMFDTNYTTLRGATSSVYDSVKNRVIVFYAYPNGNPSLPLAAVGTVSGNTISWQNAIDWNNNQAIDATWIKAVYDPVNQKSVVFYVDSSSSAVKCQVVTTNDSYPYNSFSQPVTVATGSVVGSADYDSVSGKIVVAVYTSSTTTGSVYVGTITGTSISFGSPVTYATGGSIAPTSQSMIRCGGGAVVIVYGQNWSRYAIAGTISGTSITFGTVVTVDPNQATMRSLDYSPKDNTFIVSCNYTTSLITALKVSGTTITVGTAFQLDSDSAGAYVKYSPALQKFTVFKGLTARVVTLSGTTITTGGNITLLAEIGTNVPAPTVIYNSANSVYVMVGINNTIGTGASGYSYVFHPSYTALTSNNFIGMASGSYANGQTATVQLVGSVNSSQTGLTPGQSYYVQSNGTLSTTPGTPSVFAGTAVSATKLIVKG